MLIDLAEVTFKGGKGGSGRTSFRKNKKGQDGGNGGDGGNLFVVAKNDLKLLNQFSRETVFSAADGEPGGKNQRDGKRGQDLTIFLPHGTSIIDKKTGKEIISLDTVGERILLARGGKGGLGNWELRTEGVIPPKRGEPGRRGETRELILSLKLIADLGLIGLPNAGKSSLLNELTGTHAKTANYPFTTLSPSLGILNGKVIADIPGLIEGASSGRGLGIAFLKHIEKVKVLLHCISSESTDVIKDYKVIRGELAKFNPFLSEKKEIILLTKSDLVDKEEIKSLKHSLSSVCDSIYSVSINDWDSLEALKKTLDSI